MALLIAAVGAVILTMMIGAARITQLVAYPVAGGVARRRYENVLYSPV